LAISVRFKDVLKNLRYIFLNILIIFLITYVWWLIKTDKTLIEFIESLMWVSGLNMLLGGMILVGSQKDGWSEGEELVDLNKNPVNARMKRFGEVKKIVVILVLSGGIVLIAFYLLWKSMNGTI